MKLLPGLLLLGPALTAAQSPSAPPPRGAAERIEVRLAQFDVVVRDKKGTPVSGLGPDAFVVLEDGTPLEVVAVDEWGAPHRPKGATPVEPSKAPAAEAPATVAPSADDSEAERRSFVFVFDALGESTALRMNQAKNAASAFAREHLRAEDLAAVYQLDMSLRPLSTVTSNPQEIARAIKNVTWMAASSLQDAIAESVLGYGSTGANPYMEDRLARQSINASQQMDWQREHIYTSLTDLSSVFRDLPGRRVMVFVSPGFSLTAAGDPRAGGAGGLTPKFRALIRSLAQYGVTVYSLDIGNDLAAGDVSEKIDWRVAVGKLGMDENTLSDLGLERALGSSSASSRREFLGVIASETGGRMLTQTDLSKAFAAIEEESTRFYRISCRVPITTGADRYRKLIVKVKTPGLTVATRKGRYSDIAPQDRKPNAGTNNVETIDRLRPLATRGVAVPLPGSSDAKEIAVDVVIEALGPIQLPTDPQGDAALDIEFHLVARAEDEIVDRYDRSFTARVKREGVARLVREGFRVEGRLSLVPGIYQLQGSVRLGEPPQLASWSASVAVPPPSKVATPLVAGALIAASDERESPLLSGATVAEGADALLLKPGLRLLPTTRPDIESGTDVFVLFWLRGFPEQQGEQPPQLDLKVEVADPGGRPLPVPAKILFFGKDPAGGYRAVAGVRSAELSAGAYTLRLGAAPAGGGTATARYDVPFVVGPKDAAPPATSSSAPPP